MTKEALFEVLNDLDDAHIAQVEAVPVRKHHWKIWVGLAACAAAVLAMCLTLPALRTDPAPSAHQDPAPAATQTPSAAQTPDAIHLDMGDIHINELSELTAAAPLWYDPELYDQVWWDQEDLLSYFGRNLTPAYLPEGISPAPWNDQAQVVVDKDSAALVQDRVVLHFYHAYGQQGNPQLTEDVPARKGFSLSASRLGFIGDCLYVRPEDEAQVSCIGETEVIFGYRSMPYGPYDPDTHSPAGYYNLCVAEFTSGGIRYQIVMEQMAPEELVKVTASLLWGTDEIVLDF